VRSGNRKDDGTEWIAYILNSTTRILPDLGRNHRRRQVEADCWKEGKVKQKPQSSVLGKPKISIGGDFASKEGFLENRRRKSLDKSQENQEDEAGGGRVAQALWDSSKLL